MYDLEKEKREAVKAGERALASLKSAKSKLDEAKSWGVVDILGGGIVSSLIKRSKMDDANAYMEQAKIRDVRMSPAARSSSRSVRTPSCRDSTAQVSPGVKGKASVSSSGPCR